MKKTLLAMLTTGLTGLVALGTTGVSSAAVINFTGGTAILEDGTTVTTNNFNLYQDRVDYYIEDGIKIDFIGGYGTIGDYYSIGAGGFVGNDVIHSHWAGISAIVFSKLDGTPFDLNYFDLTSNTVIGGGQQQGTERSYITASNGFSMLLPSSDWGFDYDYFGQPGDGIARLWLDDNFDGITSFAVTSENAYCFGLDNFYIDEPPPSTDVPEPSTLGLLGSSLFVLAGVSRKRKTL